MQKIDRLRLNFTTDHIVQKLHEQHNHTKYSYTNENGKVMSHSNDDKLKEFYIENTDLPDVYNLYKIDNNTFTDFFDIAYIPNIVSSNFVRDLFINKALNTKIKIECKYVSNFNKWTPIKVL